jgi:hypothetical protein|uniref:hypothetical protein n=1 Tax=Gelidibacter sp. TaxID=2018083 RepID=UPI004049C19B
MKHLLIEGGDYALIILIVLAIMFGIPIIIALIGYSYRNKKEKTAKVFYIIAGVYMLISLGFCGSMML